MRLRSLLGSSCHQVDRVPVRMPVRVMSPLLAPEPFMKIIIGITVVETLMLTLWLAYSYSRRRKPNLRIAGPTFDHRDSSLLSPSPGNWSTINRSQLQGKRRGEGARKKCPPHKKKKTER